MTLIAAVRLAMIRTGTLTRIACDNGLLLKYGTKYSKITPADTNRVASQIRRCQKRVNATG
ncbi:MAG: hypothetical protein JWN26_657 [Candidatus Saccharibacteria bacterium]|nr:hypothetical protein [Candidatus Saccharibacteria bacterium]